MRERARKPVSGGNYLLTGLLVCGKCGAKMRYQKWGKTDCKIICYSADKSKRHLMRDPNCNNKRHSAWEIEEIVLEDLFSLGVDRGRKGDRSGKCCTAFKSPGKCGKDKAEKVV